jgi:hypothetical protein
MRSPRRSPCAYGAGRAAPSAPSRAKPRPWRYSQTKNLCDLIRLGDLCAEKKQLLNPALAPSPCNVNADNLIGPIPVRLYEAEGGEQVSARAESL